MFVEFAMFLHKYDLKHRRIFPQVLQTRNQLNKQDTHKNNYFIYCINKVIYLGKLSRITYL